MEMNFLRAILGIVVTVVLAFVLGRTQDSKNPATHVYSYLGAITVLLLLRWFL